MLTGIEPAQVLAATIADTKGPCVTRKPGVIESRQPCLPAAQRFRECNNLETNTLRIGESKLIFAIECESVLVICYPSEAPGAEPVTFGDAESGRGKRSYLRQNNFGKDDRFGCWTGHRHEGIIRSRLF